VTFAWHGLRAAARAEPHMRAHLMVAILALGAGVAAGATGVELAVFALAIGLVLSAELLNTAIERLVDTVSADVSPAAAAIKNAAAASVLVAAVMAASAGALVLGRHVGMRAAVIDRGIAALVALGCLTVLAAGAVRSGGATRGPGAP